MSYILLSCNSPAVNSFDEDGVVVLEEVDVGIQTVSFYSRPDLRAPARAVIGLIDTEVLAQ